VPLAWLWPLHWLFTVFLFWHFVFAKVFPFVCHLLRPPKSFELALLSSGSPNPLRAVVLIYGLWQLNNLKHSSILGQFG